MLTLTNALNLTSGGPTRLNTTDSPQNVADLHFNVEIICCRLLFCNVEIAIKHRFDYFSVELTIHNAVQAQRRNKSPQYFARRRA